MNKLDSISKFIVEKLVPAVKEAAVPISKSIFCSFASTKKKKELVISRVRKMSEEELDEIIKKNHPLGFLGVYIYSREAKVEKIIEAINKMSDAEINEIIMNS
jgi:hypothetical protein